MNKTTHRAMKILSDELHFKIIQLAQGMLPSIETARWMREASEVLNEHLTEAAKEA